MMFLYDGCHSTNYQRTTSNKALVHMSKTISTENLIIVGQQGLNILKQTQILKQGQPPT